MDTKTERVSIWSNRDYVWWLAGDTTGMIGRVFSLLIVSFVVYDLTGSEASAGTLQTIILVLMLVASIPGGVIVDRMDRRRLIYIYAVFGSIVSGAIFLYVYSGNLTYLSFVILMSILGVVHGFFGEVTNASLRSILSGPAFVKAQAANQGRDAAVQILARPLSGFLYGLFAWLPYLVSAVFCAVQGFVFARIQKSLVPTWEEQTAASQAPLPAAADENAGLDQGVGAGASAADIGAGGSGADGLAEEPARAKTTMIQDFGDGLRYLAERKTLLMIGIISTLLNLGLAGVQSLMTLSLIAQGYPAVEVGYLGVAIGVAIILSSTVAGRIAERYPTGLIILVSLAWFSVSTVPLLFSDGYWVMMGVSFGLGLCIPIANSAALGYLLGRTPEHFQGRVSSLLNVVAQALSAFAPLIAGVTLEVYDYRLVAVIFTAISATSLVIAILSPRVRRIPKPAEWETND